MTSSLQALGAQKVPRLPTHVGFSQRCGATGAQLEKSACMSSKRPMPRDARAPEVRVLGAAGVQVVGVTCALLSPLLAKALLLLQARHAVFLEACYGLTYKLAPLSTSSSWPASGCFADDAHKLGKQEVASGCGDKVATVGRVSNRRPGHLRVVARQWCVSPQCFSSVHSPTLWPPRPSVYIL